MDDVVAEISPTEMWRCIGNSRRPYILLGDCNHKDIAITRCAAAALRPLAELGGRHMLLEYDHDLFQPIIDTFNSAGRLRRWLRQDIGQLRHSLQGTSSGWAFTPAAQDEHRAVTELMITNARELGIGLQAISFLQKNEFAHLAPEVAKHMQELDRYVSEHGRLPGKVGVIYEQLYAQARARRWEQNRSMDIDRARAARTMARDGQVPVGIFYGNGHFRGAQGDGIDAHLPAAQQVHVAIADDEQSMQRQMAAYKQPDFIWWAHKGTVSVMKPAQQPGLYA